MIIWVWTWFWQVKIRFSSCSSKETDDAEAHEYTRRRVASGLSSRVLTLRSMETDGAEAQEYGTWTDRFHWWRESYVWVSSSRWTKHSTITFARWQEAELVTNLATHDFQCGECGDTQWFLTSHNKHHSVQDTWCYMRLSVWRMLGHSVIPG